MTIATLKRNTAAVQVPATVATIVIAVLLPLLIHIIPVTGNVPLGARLLPIFYAPLLAVMFFRPYVGVFAALTAPVISHWLTGHPTAPMTIILTVEVVTFTLVLAAMQRVKPRFWASALIAYAAAKLVLFGVLSVFTNIVPPAAPVYIQNSLINGIIGIVIIQVLYWLALRMTHE